MNIIKNHLFKTFLLPGKVNWPLNNILTIKKKNPYFWTRSQLHQKWYPIGLRSKKDKKMFLSFYSWNYPYDWMYGKASFLWHGSFLQIISVLGGLQKWLSYENHSHNFAERSVEKKIDFFSVKLPKTVRERKKIEKNSLKSFPLFFSPKIKLEFLNKFILKKKIVFCRFFYIASN